MPEVSYVGSAVLEAKALAAAVKAVGLSAEHFVGVAMAETPVDTGTLRASIHSGGIANRARTTSVSVRVSTGGEANEYAFFRHEGTSRMAGVPYLEGPLLSYRAVHEEFVRRAVAAAF